MGEIGYQILNITNPLPTSPPPIAVVNPPPQEPKLPMENYILLGVVTGLLFTLYFGPIISYGCFIILRRLNQYLLSHRRQSLSSTMMSPPLSHGGSAVCLVSSFKFMKGEEGDKTQLDSDTECSICLSDFEDGEEVRKLPMCDHCFHAYCIDRWLFSHFDCPLCRAPVVEPPPPPSG